MRRSVPFVLVLVLSACGQYPGVHAGGVAAVTADGVGPGRTDDAPGSISGRSGDGTAATIERATGAPGRGPDARSVSAGAGPAGTRPGVVGDEIVIGIHAPLTGAAPIEAKAFAAGSRLYWDWLHSQGKTVHGRRVRIVFADDNYTPSTAVSVCNDMVERRNAFLLIGAAGTDQINACAQYANQRSIPYISLGVQEKGLARLRTYFAVSMTYRQQMPLLGRLLAREAAQGRVRDQNRDGSILVGYVRPNTPNFNDSADALKQAAAAAGFRYRSYTVVKEGSSAEAQTVATQMQQDGVDVVVPITAPLFTIQLAINAGKQSYFPLYAGVGVSNNINQMINQVCRNDEFDGALFLSPWPGWRNVMHREFDPDFRTAAEADREARSLNRRDTGGDILLALWGLMKSVHLMLEAAGPDLTRAGFVTAAQGWSGASGLFPALRFGADDHFGARDAHVLLGRCRQEGGDYGGGGPQWVSHPAYPGLRSSF